MYKHIYLCTKNQRDTNELTGLKTYPYNQITSDLYSVPGSNETLYNMRQKIINCIINLKIAARDWLL